LDIEHVNNEYSYKMHKRRINNTSIKYRYTGNNKQLQTSWNDKDSYGERQMNIFKCQIDTYHYIYVYTIYNLIKFANI